MTNAIAQMALIAQEQAAAKPAEISKADKKAAQVKAAQEKASKIKVEKPAKAEKPASAKTEFDAENACKAMHAAIIERFKLAGSKTLETDAKFFTSNPDYARDVLKSAHAAGVDVDSIIARIPCNDKANAAFIGVKVITKIRQFMTAVHTKDPRDTDGYTNAIIRNVLVNGALDVHDMMRCVSRMVEADNALRSDKAVTAYKQSSANTADTQTSSSRMMLGIVGVMNVSKGKKGDRPAFIKTKISRAYRALVKKAYNIETENETAEIAEGAAKGSNC